MAKDRSGRVTYRSQTHCLEKGAVLCTDNLIGIKEPRAPTEVTEGGDLVAQELLAVVP
ncbi:Hypothetical predicted protein [Pelobates cultripes]|uniref:Uncharacterized protein n=1 Tax=Pelobates cultripes TaxID=61616 RepID=A0AAD1W8E5_PELCU|nr:Hypothetical predicted protein [Pelobates cultripes]